MTKNNFGKFEIIEESSKDETGVVYKAFDVENEKMVELKVYYTFLTSDLDFVNDIKQSFEQQLENSSLDGIQLRREIGEIDGNWYQSSELLKVEEQEVYNPTHYSELPEIDTNRNNNKKNKKILWIFLGLIIAVTAFGLLFAKDKGLFKKFHFSNKSISSKNVEKLQMDTRLGIGIASVIKFSPDGKKIATGGVAGIITYDANTLEQMEWISLDIAVADLVYSPDGKTIYSIQDNSITKWNILNGESITSINTNNKITTIDVSPDGSLIAVGDDLGSISFRNTSDLQETEVFTCEDGLTIKKVGFSPDGESIAASHEGGICIWNIQEPLSTSHFSHDSIKKGFNFSPDGSKIAIAGWNEGVMIVDTARNDLIKTLKYETDSPFVLENLIDDVRFTPDGNAVVSFTDYGSFLSWDLQEDVITLNYNKKHNYLVSADLSLSENKLAGLWTDGSIQVWRIGNEEPLITKKVQNQSIFTLIYFNDYELIITGSGMLPGTISGWMENYINPQVNFPGSSVQVYSMDSVYYPKENFYLYAIGSYDGELAIMSYPKDAKEVLFLNGHEDHVRTVAFSKDGKLLATGSNDLTVNVWDPMTGDLIYTLEGHNEPVRSVTFSNDGKLLVSASDDKTIKVWKVDDGTLIKTIDAHDDRVRCVRFTNDSKFLISSGNDYKVKIWRVKDWELEKTLEDLHETYVANVALSPDQKLLASADTDGNILFWSFPDGAPLYSAEQPSWVTSLTFSNDGETLFTTGYDGSIRIWRIHEN